MTRRLHLGLKSAYVLAVAGALGFGSRELIASPTGTAALACTPTQQMACNEYCGELGYDYGLCNTPYGCQCYYRMCGGVQC